MYPGCPTPTRGADVELLCMSTDPIGSVVRLRGELDCASGPGVEYALLRPDPES